MKLVINKRYGGFGLSYKAVMRYAELAGITLYASVEKSLDDMSHYRPYDGSEEEREPLIYYHTQPLVNETYPEEADFSENEIERHNLNLIKVVEELGAEANGRFAKLKIIEIPDDIDYEIESYDGMETVSETHRRWS
jgi:hypothetical protein